MKKLNFLTMFLLMIFFVSSVEAKDIYVKTGSSGDGSSPSSPLPTIDDALRRAFSGDVIHVAKGDYFGPGKNGLFLIEKPNLTLVGGYNDDFTQRNPFENITRLMRGASSDPLDCTRLSARCREVVERQKVPETKAQYNMKGIVVGANDHTNFIMDGFVVDGYTRNSYKINDDLSLAKGPIGTACVIMYQPGVKIRNTVVLNCAGPGIQMAAVGTKLPRGDERESGDDWNELSNSIVFNTLGKSLDFSVGNMSQANPDKGTAIIKNNTLAFNWDYTGQDTNLIVGNQTQLTVVDNIFAFAGLGLRNGLGNTKARLKGNVFFSHTLGHYEYMDRANSVLIMDEPNLLKDMDCKLKYKCSKQSEGNIISDPKFKNLDSFFLDKFFNQIASQGGGKVSMDIMNQWRSAVGLNLQGSKGSGRENFAPVWDPGANWENIKLVATNPEIASKGVQLNGLGGSFQVYKSESGGATASAVKKEYQTAAWDDLKRGGKLANQAASTPNGIDVQVELEVKEQQMTGFYLDSKGIKPDQGWESYYDGSRTFYLYVKKGTTAQSVLLTAQKQGVPILVKGTIYALEGKATAGRVGLIIDEAVSLDED